MNAIARRNVEEGWRDVVGWGWSTGSFVVSPMKKENMFLWVGCFADLSAVWLVPIMFFEAFLVHRKKGEMPYSC
jgi:hypothetical protein